MQIVGILNCTADSFSDGGKYLDTENATNKLKSLFSDGADILDIGAQATNYNAKILPWQEEWGQYDTSIHLITNSDISPIRYNK